jgi:uncharacterized protein YecE (DUF72 family)
MFDDDADGGAEGARTRVASQRPVGPADVDQATRVIAESLPRSVRLGTSSWSFPGWTGLVYAPRDGRPESESRLAKHGLAAYAVHPLFRTVSLDRTFYAPISADAFAAYAALVPERFRFVVKAPQAFTDPVVRRPGSGMATRENRSFLDAAAAIEAFVTPALAGLGPKAGPLVFQFPPLGRRFTHDVRRTAGQIAAFLAALPQESLAGGRQPIYAVEVRDPELACETFAEAVRDAGGVPCLAVHARMPPVAEQISAFGLDTAGCDLPVVARWNLHAGRQYEEAKSDYFPFDRLVEEDLPSRRALAALARLAAELTRDVYITVNNKAEGSAPLSVARLAAAIAAHAAT